MFSSSSICGMDKGDDNGRNNNDSLANNVINDHISLIDTLYVDKIINSFVNPINSVKKILSEVCDDDILVVIPVQTFDLIPDLHHYGGVIGLPLTNSLLDTDTTDMVANILDNLLDITDIVTTGINTEDMVIDLSLVLLLIFDDVPSPVPSFPLTNIPSSNSSSVVLGLPLNLTVILILVWIILSSNIKPYLYIFLSNVSWSDS